MNSSPYQLTRHSIGSLKEIWTISWPLMLGLLSNSCMLFADRLLLSRYSTAALNACATAGMAAYALLIIPMIIAGISEVFVGRNHGAGNMREVGKAVWQMLWLSIGTLPIFLLSISLFPSIIFSGTGNEALETIYFQWIIYFGPFFCMTIALSGFFIGIGQVTIVTACAVLGNVVNIGLDYLFIFGYGPIPEMGIKGAALATGLSQIVQTICLGWIFLRKSNRETYGSGNMQFDLSSFQESIRIGAPAGLGRFIEVIGHFIFFRIVLLSGSENMTIMTIVQSVYLLLAFTTEGLSKGVSTIAANLMGGKQSSDLMDKVLKSAMALQSIFSGLLFILLMGFSYSLMALFFNDQDISFLQNARLKETTQIAFFWLCVFFLFDGFSWIYIGFLTACGDTKFLLYASFILNLVCYGLPAYLIIGLARGTAAQGWMLIAWYAMMTFFTYRWRYKLGKWKENKTAGVKELVIS